MNNKNKFTANNLSYEIKQKLLFQDVSFELHAGSLLLLEGENGAGKSSLLKLLAGLATPLGGNIRWNDALISQSLEFNEDLHYMGHMNGLKTGLSVVENIYLAYAISSERNNHPNKEFISKILARLKLEPSCLARELSAGQKRKLALARLFLLKKSCWILDEPLTALDTASQQYFLEKLSMHMNEGGIAIVSTHHHLPFSHLQAQTLRLGK